MKPETPMKCGICNRLLNWVEMFQGGEIVDQGWDHPQKADHPAVPVEVDAVAAPEIVCDFCGGVSGEVAWIECDPFQTTMANGKESKTFVDDGGWSMCQECLDIFDIDNPIPMIERAVACHQARWGTSAKLAQRHRENVIEPVYKTIWGSNPVLHLKEGT